MPAGEKKIRNGQKYSDTSVILLTMYLSGGIITQHNFMDAICNYQIWKNDRTNYYNRVRHILVGKKYIEYIPVGKVSKKKNTEKPVKAYKLTAKGVDYISSMFQLPSDIVFRLDKRNFRRQGEINRVTVNMLRCGIPMLPHEKPEVPYEDYYGNYVFQKSLGPIVYYSAREFKGLFEEQMRGSKICGFLKMYRTIYLLYALDTKNSSVVESVEKKVYDLFYGIASKSEGIESVERIVFGRDYSELNLLLQNEYHYEQYVRYASKSTNKNDFKYFRIGDINTYYIPTSSIGRFYLRFGILQSNFFRYYGRSNRFEQLNTVPLFLLPGNLKLIYNLSMGINPGRDIVCLEEELEYYQEMFENIQTENKMAVISQQTIFADYYAYIKQKRQGEMQ